MAFNLSSGAARSRRRRGSRRAPMAEINVTPFVDVVLVLLIIFMVTAPLLTAGVPVDLPDSRARPLDQPDRPPVQIALDGEGRLFIDNEEIALDTLPARLETVAGERDDADRPPAIMLRADRTLDYGRVMAVMGELNRVGLTRVSMVTVTTGSAARTDN